MQITRGTREGTGPRLSEAIVKKSARRAGTTHIELDSAPGRADAHTILRARGWNPRVLHPRLGTLTTKDSKRGRSSPLHFVAEVAGANAQYLSPFSILSFLGLINVDALPLRLGLRKRSPSASSIALMVRASCDPPLTSADLSICDRAVTPALPAALLLRA